MSLNEVHAFTAEHENVVTQLFSSAKLSANGRQIEVKALWDTGASVTAISMAVVAQLGLVSQGKMRITTPASSKVVNTYLVDIGLPNNVVVFNVKVCDSDIGDQGIGLLIGMNIISLGDFAVSNYAGKTNFSFRVPSQRAVDYRAAAVWGNNIARSHGKNKARK